MELPRLILKEVYNFNIVQYGGKFYGLAIDVGNLRLESISSHDLNELTVQGKIVSDPDLEKLILRLQTLRPIAPQHLSVSIQNIRQWGRRKLSGLLRRLNRVYLRIRYKFTYAVLPRLFFYARVLVQPKFSILVPTRGRSSRCNQMIIRMLETARRPHLVEFLLLVDEDDPEPYETVLRPLMQTRQVRLFRRPPTPMSGERYNFLASQAKGSIFMYAADDIVFHTYGWDLIIANEYAIYADEIVLCSDRGSEVPLHGFISARSYRLLGYIFPPYFVYCFSYLWMGSHHRE
jgi:hypothetical protein